MESRLSILLVACCFIGAQLAALAADNQQGEADSTNAKGPYDHILVIMLENVGYNNVIGSPNAPYINKTLLSQGTLFTKSFGVRHPSLPNYLALFAGTSLWVRSDHCINGNPPNGPFNSPNLYSELRKIGKTARGYMESLPYDGFKGCAVDYYVQKHNPFMFFNSGTVNKVPYSASVVYKGPYPATAKWPNFAMICPNELHDMHDGSNFAVQVRNGDAWLSRHLPPLITYAKNNNGLVILTMDESNNQHIPTIVAGYGIPGRKTVSHSINHYNVTKTVVDNFGLHDIGHTEGVPPLVDVTP